MTDLTAQGCVNGDEAKILFQFWVRCRARAPTRARAVLARKPQ